MEGKQPFAFLSGGTGFSHGAFAEPLGKSGEVFLFSYIKLEVVVFVQDVVAERDSKCGKLLVDFTQTGLFVGRKIGAGTDKFLMGFFQQPLLFAGQAESIFLAVDSIHFLEKLLVEGDVVFVFGQCRSQFHGKGCQFIGSFGLRQVEKYTAYTVQGGRAVVEGNNDIFESRGFRIVNDGLDIGVLLFYTFLECGFIVLQLDFIEWRHAIGCLKLGKERIAFRLGGTGVHHTTYC